MELFHPSCTPAIKNIKGNDHISFLLCEIMRLPYFDIIVD